MRSKQRWAFTAAAATGTVIAALGAADNTSLPTGTVTAITAVGAEVTAPDGTITQNVTLRGGTEYGQTVSLLRNPDGTWIATPATTPQVLPLVLMSAGGASAAYYMTLLCFPAANPPHSRPQNAAPRRGAPRNTRRPGALHH